MSETADRMDRDELKDVRRDNVLLRTALLEIQERVQVEGEHQSWIWNVAEKALRGQRPMASMTESLEANIETFPPCKHCGHPGEDHDEEFGNCSDCECPGYEEAETNG